MKHKTTTSNRVTTCLAMIALLAASSAQADVIADYDFASSNFTSSDSESLTSAQDLVAGNTALGESSIGMTHVDGAAFTSPVTSPAIAGEFGDIGSALSGTTTLADAIGGDLYHSFTINRGSAQSIDFSSFTIDINKTTGGATVDTALFSDLTGGFTSGNEIDQISTSADTNTSFTLDYDLTGETALQGVTASSVEFRIYVYTSASTGSHDFAMDNLTLNGVPEPSSFALLAGCFGLTWVMLRRRA